MPNSKRTEDRITLFMQVIEYKGSPRYNKLQYSIRDRTVDSIRILQMLSGKNFLKVFIFCKLKKEDRHTLKI